jgi:hypothetical protein
VVENIEKLRTKLEAEALGEMEILEEREVQPAESRSGNLRGGSAQSVEVS